MINRLVSRAIETRTEWWIVMDDLGKDEAGQPLVDTSVREFFQQFAVTYVDPQFRERFRLMLIGLPAEGRATHWDRNAYLERTLAEADVTPAHVGAALREGAERRGKVLGPQAADELAERVFAAARRARDEGAAAVAGTPGVEPPAMLQCLHDAAVTALDAI